MEFSNIPIPFIYSADYVFLYIGIPTYIIFLCVWLVSISLMQLSQKKRDNIGITIYIRNIPDKMIFQRFS